MVSSLIAVLMTGGSRGAVRMVYGDRSELGYSVKFFLILVCFLVTFLLNVQSIRYYNHASILINVPYTNLSFSDESQGLGLLTWGGQLINRGSFFWSLGLRAFYFSFPLFLWIFGPIPMFLSCPVLVFFFYLLDIPFDFGGAAGCVSHPHQHPHNNNNKDPTTNNNTYHPTNVDLEIN